MKTKILVEIEHAKPLPQKPMSATEKVSDALYNWCFSRGVEVGVKAEIVDFAVLSDGYDGSSHRVGPNHETIEIWYDLGAGTAAYDAILRILGYPVPTVPANTPVPGAVPEDPCRARCKVGHVCRTPSCGRLKSDELRRLYGGGSD